MKDEGKVVARAGGYDLIKYMTGERRILTADRTCGSVWLTLADEEAIVADPAIMAEYDLSDETDYLEGEAWNPLRCDTL